MFRYFIFFFHLMISLFMVSSIEGLVEIAAIAQVKGPLSYSPDSPIFKQGVIPSDQIEVMIYNSAVQYDASEGSFTITNQDGTYSFFAVVSGSPQIPGEEVGIFFPKALFSSGNILGLVNLTPDIVAYGDGAGEQFPTIISLIPTSVGRPIVNVVSYFIFFSPQNTLEN